MMRWIFILKINFKVHTDADFDGTRWLTLTLPNQPELELTLMLAETPQEEELVGKQAGDKPFLCFQTDNCLKDYEELKKLGVEFLDKPENQSWGSACTFQDLYGNLLYLVQPHN